MAGNPSGGGGRGSGGSSFAGPCDRLDFEAVLSSPNPDVLPTLGHGESVEIDLNEGGIVIVKNSSGEVLGSITRDKGEKLKACIDEEHYFYGKVVEVRGHRCVVRIWSASGS
jgi:hypothetical protein